MTLNAYSDLKI